jgi:integrase
VGKIPLRQLAAADILSVCRRIEAKGKYETAHRARALASEFELDGDQPVWRIPAARMKMGEQHIVPLARQVVAILKQLQPLTGDGPLLFPSLRSKKRPISNNTVNAALRRIGFSHEQHTGHGFRSTASTLLNEQGWNPTDPRG